MIPLGKNEKMQLQAFESPEDSAPAAVYEFLVNPSTYTENFTINYNEDMAPGKNGTEARYQGQPPNDWEFEILIDGTGVIKDASALDISLIGSTNPVDVEEEVRKLKAATVDLHGESHRNYYLKVAWGERDIFKGSLVSLNLTYKLFKPDGTPLRAVAKVRLRAWVSDEERNRESDLQSPDITHERVVRDDDHLALMGYKIYKDTAYYMDVAKANNLNSFRRVAVGTSINFPPLK